MQKLLLFSFGDAGSAGIRQLASFLRMHGHLVHLVMVEGNQVHTAKTILSKKTSKTTKDPVPVYTVKTGGKSFSYSAPSSYVLPKCFLQYIQDWKPDLIGLSIRHRRDIPYAEWFSSIRVVAPHALLLAGGFGPSIAPEVFLNAGADAVCRGEGEHALLELANCLADKTNWENVANVSYKKREEIIHNPLRPVERDLDKFPQPLFYTPGIFYTQSEELIEKDPLLKSNVRYVLSGRGCIASCSYCAAGNLRNLYRNEGLKHPKYRYRNLDSVIEELMLHKKNGGTWIHISDDFFVQPPDNMRKFLDNYKTNIGVPFTCNFSPDYLHHHLDILDKADEAGLWSLGINIQSPAEPFARDIFNRKNDHRIIKELINYAYHKYIPVSIDILEGYSIPGMDDLEAKLEFIKKLPPFNVGCPTALVLVFAHLRIQPNATITQRCPHINNCLLSPKEFLYRASLLNFRYILDDEAFATLRKIKSYQNNPSALAELFQRMLNERHTNHLMAQAARLEGEEVYFYGSRDSFGSRKHLFSKVKPVAVIDDETKATEIDGIPVVNSLDILKERPLPVIVFSWRAMQAIRMIKRLLPDMPEEDIILCMPDEFPGQANREEAVQTINRLQTKINAMRSSASWKITSPLRSLDKFLSRMRGREQHG